VYEDVVSTHMGEQECGMCIWCTRCSETLHGLKLFIYRTTFSSI